jgi:hypothetical protein
VTARINHFRLLAAVLALALAVAAVALMGLRSEPAQAQSTSNDESSNQSSNTNTNTSTNTSNNTSSGENRGDARCVGTLPPGVYQNVTVPEGQTCDLTNSTVRGNVKALENSKLFAADNIVLGNIEGDKAEVMDLRRNTVGGNIDIKEGETNDPEDDVQVFANILPNGDIKVEKMTGEIEVGVTRIPAFANIVPKGNIFVQENLPVAGPEGLEVSTNSVGENLQVFKNRGDAPKIVQNNTVGENLQCFENDPPFVGGPNIAQKAEGQCFVGLP